jgi:hypothetical protein
MFKSAPRPAAGTAPFLGLAAPAEGHVRSNAYLGALRTIASPTMANGVRGKATVSPSPRKGG